jgi:hypothetical protein
MVSIDAEDVGPYADLNPASYANQGRVMRHKIGPTIPAGSAIDMAKLNGATPAIVFAANDEYSFVGTRSYATLVMSR